MLIAIKLLHTAAWAFFAGCIFALPFTAKARRFGWTLALSLIVCAECVVLLLNHFRCPLTDIAARYTSDRSPNFDIYLPAWIAATNKSIFGFLFAVFEIFAVWTWYGTRRDRHPVQSLSHKL